MQQITTYPYHLEKKRYFHLLVKLFFKRKWYLIALLTGIVIYNISTISENNFARFFVIFGIVYIPIHLYRIYRWVYSKNNANYFIESVLTDIEDNETKISVATFVKMTQTKDEYLLYLSQNNFSYIPKAAFKTDEDRQYFEEIINQNIIS